MVEDIIAAVGLENKDGIPVKGRIISEEWWREGQWANYRLVFETSDMVLNRKVMLRYCSEDIERQSYVNAKVWTGSGWSHIYGLSGAQMVSQKGGVTGYSFRGKELPRDKKSLAKEDIDKVLETSLKILGIM